MRSPALLHLRTGIESRRSMSDDLAGLTFHRSVQVLVPSGV